MPATQDSLRSSHREALIDPRQVKWPPRLFASSVHGPVAILDVEATFCEPPGRRLIEVSVVRVEPRRQAPRVRLDTLVNPQRWISGYNIHRITSDHVREAPRFEDIAGNIVKALAGCVIAGYNVSYDISVLQDEFRRLGFPFNPPRLCLMRLRSLLGLGPKCSLKVACQEHGIEHKDEHRAVSDALAGARLWKLYRRTMMTQGLRTYGDLFRNFYLMTLTEPLLPLRAAKSLRSSRSSRLKPRGPP